MPMTANGTPIPYGVQIDEIDSKRRQAGILEALSHAPARNYGTARSVVSPLAEFSKLISGYSSKKKEKEARKMMEKLTTQQKNDLVQGIQQFQQTAQGSSNPSSALAPNPDGSPQMVNTPGNMQQAIADAMANQHPGVQAYGQNAQDHLNKQMMQAQKGQLTPRDLAKHATSASVLASGGNPAMFDAKAPELQAFTPGSAIINKDTGKVADLNTGMQVRTLPDGSRIQGNDKVGWKAMGGGGTTINNTINGPAPTVSESAFRKESGKLSAQEIHQQRMDRPKRVASIQAIDNALALAKQGIFAGTWANTGMTLNKASRAIFGSDAAKAARTEQFTSEVGRNVIGNMELLGGSDTVEEMKYMKQIEGGEISMEPEAIIAMLESARNKLMLGLQYGDSVVQQAKADGHESFDLPNSKGRAYNERPGEPGFVDVGQTRKKKVTLDELMAEAAERAKKGQ